MSVRVRMTKAPWIMGESSQLNTSSVGEIIVMFRDAGNIETVPGEEYDAYINALGAWKHIPKAFNDRDLITDNYNRYFFEPANDEERARGYR